MKVCLVVLDSLGIGFAPDAADFGDSGSNTLKAISKSKEFWVPELIKSGLGNIDSVDYLPSVASADGDYGRLYELNPNKDTVSGHWEMAGVVAPKFKTFPEGFPKELIGRFERETGYRALVNRPYSGTEVIRDFGIEQLKGGVIVYTSADSVLQIAAHTDVVPLEKLYEICLKARKIADDYAIARVIARPFAGAPGSFYRTTDRKDFSMPPPRKTLLSRLSERGFDVIGIGKISDIFCGEGLTESYHISGNDDGITTLEKVMKKPFNGLCFVNLVDFDMLYGHRNDVDGYARALSRFDRALPRLKSLLGAEDSLIITADHGCDPSTPSTDHSREAVPILCHGAAFNGSNRGTKYGFFEVSRIIEALFGI